MNMNYVLGLGLLTATQVVDFVRAWSNIDWTMTVFGVVFWFGGAWLLYNATNQKQ